MTRAKDQRETEATQSAAGPKPELLAYSIFEAREHYWRDPEAKVTCIKKSDPTKEKVCESYLQAKAFYQPPTDWST